MTPNTILSILTLKMYLGHVRLQGITNNLININLEKLQIKCGQNITISDIPKDEKHWTTTWLDHIFDICKKRRIKVEHETNFLAHVTKNKTVIDYTVQYNKTSFTLGRINQVRLYKRYC